VMHSMLNSYSLVLGNPIGLVSRITHQSNVTRGVAPHPIKEVVVTANMDVVLPDGEEEVIPMHDDGLHFDGAANDGVYGATIPATEVGLYRAQAVLTGVDDAGNKFIRTTEHLIPVVADEVQLVGTATAFQKDDQRISIQLDVTATAKWFEVDENFRAYAQVWGKDANNNDVAACWISSLVNIEGAVEQYVEVQLDKRWLERAHVQLPLTLKNVYIQDISKYVPLSTVDEIPVKMSPEVETMLQHLPVPSTMKTVVTKEMTQGVFPAELLNRTRAAAAPTLVLVHGYCAATNPWNASPYTQDFTSASYFLKASSSLSHEQMAKEVFSFTESQKMTSFGAIGHSQGGHALAHLMNYYFSGLDQATSTGKKVQAVGTPWMGCTGAGSAANLVKVFGVGCGANNDLTPDGSQLWLTGISKEVRSEIYYYTSTYKLGNLFGDYCNMAVNMVLEWPNDGVTELEYAQLTGGNNMGNKEKWCHTTDMSYNAQYYDRSRNAILNKDAAR